MDNPFSKNITDIISTLIKLFQCQDKPDFAKVLQNSVASLEHTHSDSWDGGTDYYTLYLEIPVELFAAIEASLKNYEQGILEKTYVVLRTNGRRYLNNVIIRPHPVESSMALKTSEEDVMRIWSAGYFRLFISHSSTDKMYATEFKKYLEKFEVSGFVAHDDIEPTLPWLEEIKRALHTMHAFVALLTPEFKESKYTDQEVGFALAREVLIIHVRSGLDPYGFIAETQSLSFPIDQPEKLSSEIIDVLLKSESTKHIMREALFLALEKSYGHTNACKVMKKIESAGSIKPEEIKRIRTIAQNNTWVKDAYTVKKFLSAHNTNLIDEVPF